MIDRKQHANAKRPRRPGMILAVVVAALLVVALIGASMTRTVLTQRRAARRIQHEQQSAWFADSALQRGLARLASEPTYRGETWRVASDAMPTGLAGVATIRVEIDGTTQRIVVEAVYPEHPVHRILQRREFNVEPISPGGSS